MEHVDADVAAVVAAYAQAPRRHPDGAPWVMLNMITSIDGAISVDGLSGGLGTSADQAVFAALRGVADVIVVASGTAAAEDYGAPSVRDDIAAARAARGQNERPVVAVLSRSLRLDLTARLFTTAGFRPVIVTVVDAPADRLRAVEAVADVVAIGTGDIELGAAVDELAARHGPVVLVEGGPTLNSGFAAADLFHEVCVSTGPLLVGGDSGRMIATGHQHPPRRFVVDQVHAAGGMTFTRWLREK